MVVISEVEPRGLGQRAGFEVGDRVHRVNAQEIQDPIDFQVHTADPSLLFEVERDGQLYEVEVERAPGEGFGLAFEEVKLRRCNNNCVFCFIHQMPAGMRRSLYFEDDDYRLSFLHGSYVTLTNVRDEDLQRIVEQRLSPQYLSVHATEPELRQRLLGRRRAPVDILERIRRLAEGGIEMHTQVVLCPGWNDGEHLARSVHDLAAFHPRVRSVALVPVGLTRFRAGLPGLQPVTPELARRYVEQAAVWGQRFMAEHGERFVYAADELFLLAGAQPPAAEYYGVFPQIENGIGMVRALLDTWERGRHRLPRRVGRPFRLGLVTGRLASTFMQSIVGELSRIQGLRADLLVVENDFFGRGITVSGLLTGHDILGHLRDGGPWDRVLLPPNCINGDGLTLDDMTVEQLEAAAGVPVCVGGYDLPVTLGDVLGGRGMQRAGSGRQLPELGYSMGRRP
ncbi:MAG: DUF512 domain-containing protein [Candidatus Latescibacterota bacterium]